MQDQINRIESKLSSIDSKLDIHLDRIAKAETSVTWLKWALSIVTSILFAFGSILANLLTK